MDLAALQSVATSLEGRLAALEGMHAVHRLQLCVLDICNVCLFVPAVPSWLALQAAATPCTAAHHRQQRFARFR
jgi:hypothetical protein